MPFPSTTRGMQIGAVIVGVVLLACAAALYASSGGALDGPAWIGLVLLAGLGLEELACGVLGRRSLLARVGPLP